VRTRRAVTIVDIARAAGVSRTTASAALGGAGRVSGDTRERVRAVAEGLGYVANPTARHLQAGRTGAIGIYVPENLFGFTFYMEFVFGAAEASRDDAFAVTLMSGRRTPAPAAHVDGVIMVDPVAGDPMVATLLSSGVPVVSAERYLDTGPQPLVTIESGYEVTQRQMLDHLWERGARAPALLSIPTDFAWKRMVERTYREWCDDHGVDAHIRVLEHGAEHEAVHRQARSLLRDRPATDAIVAGADGAALGALGAARDLGRAIGDDLLLASCIDSVAMRLATPAVTAIDAPPRDIGGDAARALLAVLRGEDLPATIQRARPRLAIRDSTAGRATGPPSAGDARPA
jgi:DNA-binding LacI/PurR family transcriptional regulator